SDSEKYFGCDDMPYRSTDTGKQFQVTWTANAASGTWYMNMDSATVNTANQMATGTYSGPSGQVTTTPSGVSPLSVLDILGKTTSVVCNLNTTPKNYASCDDWKLCNGDKAVYVLLSSSTGTDGGGGTSGLQDNVQPLYLTFKVTPPGTPTIVSSSGGMTNIKISANWAKDSSDADKGGFVGQYRPVAADGTPMGDFKETSTYSSSNMQISGLINDQQYEVQIKQIDRARNRSYDWSASAFATPTLVYDYYEYYRSQGGGEEGGFCFIATAAYGSPSHPFVGTLREFRDSWLMDNDAGRSFVSTYYSMSPPAAEFIRQHPVLRLVAGTMLLPLVSYAWFFMHPLAMFGAFFAVGAAVAVSRRKSSIWKMLAVLAAAALIALLTAPGTASAESPRNFQLEIKFGPFYPMYIDKEKALHGTAPYRTTFGNTSLLMTQIEFDYIVYDKMGTVSVGGSFGFWQAVGKGRVLIPGGSQQSTDTTVFNIIPLAVDVAYRFDYFATKKNFPLVPYVKFGIDCYTWWVTDGLGSTDSFIPGTKPYGAKWGFHVSGGLAFLLDFIDPNTANDFDVSTGINNTYIFAEWVMSRINNFGQAKGFNLSSDTFMAGLMFEF
ncbi:MAG: MXAN_2562 family outer membrane beta-barrel protein, partial [Myxococcota bacterium]